MSHSNIDIEGTWRNGKEIEIQIEDLLVVKCIIYDKFAQEYTTSRTEWDINSSK